MNPDEVESSRQLVIDFIAPNASVLVVDDSKTNIEVASLLLSPYNMRIETADNGFEAIQKMQKNDFDLVFMDHLMPEIDGIETVRFIRKALVGKGKNTKIVALSANTMQGAREYFIENGMDDFLPKPFDPRQLCGVLKQYLPPEKQQPREADLVYKVEKSTGGIHIPGVDTDEGMRNCGSDLDAYLSVLTVFYLDGVKTLPKLRAYIENHNDVNLIITIHALKSACANVGATVESAMAEKLEHACENNDIVYLQEHLHPFAIAFDALLGKICPVVQQSQDTSRGPLKKGEVQALDKGVRQLADALLIADSNTIDAVLADLLSFEWPEPDNTVLKRVQTEVELFEFDEAEKILRQHYEC